jgi:hypothetical protein
MNVLASSKLMKYFLNIYYFVRFVLSLDFQVVLLVDSSLSWKALTLKSTEYTDSFHLFPAKQQEIPMYIAQQL